MQVLAGNWGEKTSLKQKSVLWLEVKRELPLKIRTTNISYWKISPAMHTAHFLCLSVRRAKMSSVDCYIWHDSSTCRCNNNRRYILWTQTGHEIFFHLTQMMEQGKTPSERLGARERERLGHFLLRILVLHWKRFSSNWDTNLLSSQALWMSHMLKICMHPLAGIWKSPEIRVENT